MKARIFLALTVVALVAPARAQDAAAGKAKAASCVACHGEGGNSAQPQYPVLAGQTARYLYLQLRDFKENRRSDPLMSPQAANLSREDMLDLAAYFAAQRPLAVKFTVDAGKAERGRKKAEETLCTMCHLGGFKGQNEIPRVAGQHHDYVVKQLGDFKAGRRTNDAGNMTSVARNLSDQDIQDLAQYIANLS